MKQLKVFAAAAALLCGVAIAPVASAQMVKIDGSSTVFPITEAVAEDFQKAKKGEVKVTVGISGTGGGFKKFCRGETDISDASRPILKKEMDDCKAAGIEYFELPVAFDALTVVINPKNSFIKQLTVAELKKMWEPARRARSRSWNQVNPGLAGRAAEAVRAGRRLGHLRLLHRSDRRQVQVEPRRLHRVRRRQRAGAGRVARRQRARLLRLRLLRREQGQAEGGADRRTRRASRRGAVDGDRDQRHLLSRWRARSSSTSTRSRSRKPEVKEFVEYYMKHGAKLAREVKYVPLPDSAYATAWDHVQKGKKGTVFGGDAEVGVTIEELLKREAKL